MVGCFHIMSHSSYGGHIPEDLLFRKMHNVMPNLWLLLML